MSPSSGFTCAGRTKAALPLLVLLLAAGALQVGHPATASAQANPSPPSGLPLWVGFGPSSLFPVSGGAPVFTVGETMWVESGYNYSVDISLSSPAASPGASSSVVLASSLQPDQVAPVYTFNASGPDGVWGLSVETNLGPSLIPIRLVNLADHMPSLSGPLQYSLDGGDLSISSQADLGDSYDQEVCAAGSPSQSSINVTLPAAMEDYGSVTLRPGNPVGLNVLGSLNESLSFWFELYQSYAFNQGGTSNLVAQDFRAAQSQPFDILGSGPGSANLTWNAPLRAGRYDLRAYFENSSSSLSVSESTVLVLNDSSWVSLSGACPPGEAQATGISYTGSLASGEGSWPRTLYYLFRSSGVEAVAAYPVKANLSSIDFVASPWGAQVQDAKVTVSSPSGVAQTSQDGGSLFVLTSSYPAQLSYSLDIGGGPNVAQGSATFDAGYSTQVVQLSLAQLKVQLSGFQASPTTLQVTGPQGLAITHSLQKGQRTASFYLPTGSYTVTASQGGQSVSDQVELTDRAAASTSLDLGALTNLETILVVTAVIAAAANVLVLTLRSRGPRLRRSKDRK